MRFSVFKLDNSKLKFTDSIKYLGCIITNDCKDDKDINRLTRSIYARGNVLANRFYMCTHEVKVKLFKAYCSSLYGLSTCINVSNDSLKKLCLAYKRIFRKLFNFDFINTTQNMLKLRIDPFQVIQRKLFNGFYNRLNSSNNSIVCLIVETMLYRDSVFLKCFIDKVHKGKHIF